MNSPSLSPGRQAYLLAVRRQKRVSAHSTQVSSSSSKGTTLLTIPIRSASTAEY